MGLFDGIAKKIRDEVFESTDEVTTVRKEATRPQVTANVTSTPKETTGTDVLLDDGKDYTSIIKKAYEHFEDPAAQDLYRVESIVSTLGNLDEATRNSTARTLLVQFGRNLNDLQVEAVDRIESIQNVTLEFEHSVKDDSEHIENEIETRKKAIAERSKELEEFITRTNQEIADLNSRSEEAKATLLAEKVAADKEVTRLNNIIKILEA